MSDKLKEAEQKLKELLEKRQALLQQLNLLEQEMLRQDGRICQIKEDSKLHSHL